MITRRLARPLSALSSSTSWTCPSCARASLLQQKLLPQLQRRKKHHVPLLDYHSTFSKEGIPGLLSSTGYRIAWTDYQEMIVNKLNELTAGEETFDMTVKNIIIKYARDPMNASLFNHASMAFNNDFFFKGLSTSPSHINDPRRASLKQSLEHTFGSMDTLRTTMLDTAAAMFGPGFVWLVTTRRDIYGGAATGGRGDWDWRILTTYNAGTPFPEAGYRHQGLDMNTSNAATYSAYERAEAVNNVGAFGRHSKSGKEDATIPPGGTKLMPVLCVNTWEHVYIYDFGIAGKRKFLADWWDAVDWYKVEANWPHDSHPRQYERDGGRYGGFGV